MAEIIYKLSYRVLDTFMTNPGILVSFVEKDMVSCYTYQLMLALRHVSMVCLSTFMWLQTFEENARMNAILFHQTYAVIC